MAPGIAPLFPLIRLAVRIVTAPEFSTPERHTELPLIEHGSSLWRHEWDYRTGHRVHPSESPPARDRVSNGREDHPTTRNGNGTSFSRPMGRPADTGISVPNIDCAPIRIPPQNRPLLCGLQVGSSLVPVREILCAWHWFEREQPSASTLLE